MGMAAVVAFTMSCKEAQNEVEATDAATEAEATVESVTYKVDTAASNIAWVGSKPTEDHTGNISLSSGMVTVNGETLESGEFTIDMTSIEVTDLEGDEAGYLKAHLEGTVPDKATDFFNTPVYPTAKFIVTGLEGNNLSGNLTLKDVTKNVTFPVTVSYDGDALNQQEKRMLKSSLRASNHPLSRTLYNSFENIETLTISDYKEIVGKGIQASYQDMNLKLGSSSFVSNDVEKSTLNTSVHVSFNEVYKGKFTFKNSYRTGVESLFNSLKNEYELSVVSGDNEGEKQYLQKSLPEETQLLFNQKPENKLDVVANLQKQGKKIAMIGDGLNDAGALAQSDVGIALSENINVFSPACDGILDASKFYKIATFLKASKKAIKIIKYCFILSLCYNVIGLYFAVTGQLMPVIAAILMPLSSISIVVFTTISTNLLGTKIK